MSTPCCEPDCSAETLSGSDACAAHAGLTTLDAANRLANAVLAAPDRGDDDLLVDPPTQAVLRELRAMGMWLCRIGEDSQGVTTYERMPDVQGELFR